MSTSPVFEQEMNMFAKLILLNKIIHYLLKYF